MTEADLFCSEASVSTSFLTVELRHYHCDGTLRREFLSSSHAFLDLAVTPRIVSRGRIGWRSRNWRRLGQVIAVPPDTEFHAFVPDGGWTQSTLTCLLSQQLLASAGAPARWPDTTLEGCTDLASPDLRATLGRMLAEIRSPGFATTALLESLGAVAAIDLVRSLNSSGEFRAPRGGLATWRSRALRERLEEESLPPPGIAELAGLVGLSVRQLMRAFREEQGDSLASHIRKLSIARAQRLLLGDQVPIKQIALDLGFSSTAAFSHAFRKATGLRPTEFRSAALNGASVR